MSTELRDLLELASEDLPEVDLADRAWAVAAAERRAVRRRVLLGAGGLAAAGTLATVLAGRDRTATAPAVTATGAAGRLDERLVGELRVSSAPLPADEEALPTYPDSDVLALPPVLGTGESRPLPVLGPDGIAGTNASVRAVLLVHTAQGGYQPVVYLPRGEPRHLHAPGMLLEPVEGGRGGAGPVLGPRTIDDERHRVVVAQPRKVAVLDVRDASVTEIAVPDDTLVHAGWAHDGRTVVTRGLATSWLVDTVTHAVRRSPGPVASGWGAFSPDAEGRMLLLSFSSEGALTATRPVPDVAAVPYGEPVANLELWTAGGVVLDPLVAAALGRSQGVLAAQDDLSISPRLLAAPAVDAVPERAYRPLGWGPRDTLVLESRSADRPSGEQRRRLLAWDVIGARLWRVAEVEAAVDVPSGFSGLYAI